MLSVSSTTASLSDLPTGQGVVYHSKVILCTSGHKDTPLACRGLPSGHLPQDSVHVKDPGSTSDTIEFVGGPKADLAPLAPDTTDCVSAESLDLLRAVIDPFPDRVVCQERL